MKLHNTTLHPMVVTAMEYAMAAHPSPESDGRYRSVTELLKSPCQAALYRRHYHEAEQQAVDQVDLFLGIAVHDYIARANAENEHINEERLSCEVDGRKITGGMDAGLVYGKRNGGATIHVSDFKVVKAWAIVYKSSYPDWERQLNMYSYMLGQRGDRVHRLTIECFVKDWQAREALGSMDYPASAYCSIDFPVWPHDKTLGWMSRRVAEHVAADELPDNALPRCEDTWNGKRCHRYCWANRWCPHYKRHR